MKKFHPPKTVNLNAKVHPPKTVNLNEKVHYVLFCFLYIERVVTDHIILVLYKVRMRGLIEFIKFLKCYSPGVVVIGGRVDFVVKLPDLAADLG